MRVADLGAGWQSHVLACRFGALIVERDDCIVVRTPDNPNYYWGNCLILPRAPRDGELAHWLRRFDEEIARHQPETGIWRSASTLRNSTMRCRRGAPPVSTSTTRRPC